MKDIEETGNADDNGGAYEMDGAPAEIATMVKDEDVDEEEIAALQEMAGVFDPNSFVRDSSAESSLPPPPPPGLPPAPRPELAPAPVPPVEPMIEVDYDDHKYTMARGRGGRNDSRAANRAAAAAAVPAPSSPSEEKSNLRWQKLILQFVGVLTCLLIIVAIIGAIVFTRNGGKSQQQDAASSNVGPATDPPVTASGGNDLPTSTVSPTSLATVGSTEAATAQDTVIVTTSSTSECGQVLSVTNSSSIDDGLACFLHGGDEFDGLISITVDYAELCNGLVMPGDWLAIYPAVTEPNLLTEENFVVWSYASCGESNDGDLFACQEQTSVTLFVNNTIDFNDDGTTSYFIDEGYYRAYYVRADELALPYEASAVSDPFVIAETC